MIYDLLFKASAETMLTIAADQKHLGARIGVTSVLHTWGSAMTHHPHLHMIVPGGGLAPDGSRWISCKPPCPNWGFSAINVTFQQHFAPKRGIFGVPNRSVAVSGLSSERDSTLFSRVFGWCKFSVNFVGTWRRCGLSTPSMDGIQLWSNQPKIHGSVTSGALMTRRWKTC